MATSLHTTAPRLALLALVSCAVYANGVPAPFVADDLPTIVYNPAVADPALLADTERLDGLMGSADLRNSIKARTFAYLTFALDHRLHGPDPAGYRLGNILIHAVNACLVYLLAASLLARARRHGAEAPPQEALQARDGRLALLVALLFAVHPVNVTAVTYLTQRFTSLAALLYLLSLLAYLRGRAAASARAGAPWLVVALLATTLAMDTQETAFTLPAALTVIELMFFGGSRRRRALLLAPFYATMLIIPWTLWSSVPDAGGLLGRIARGTDLMNLDGIPRASYLFTQFRVIVTYLRMLLLPVGLSFDHDFPISHEFLAAPVLASAALLALFLALGVHLLVRAGRDGEPRRATLRVAAFGVFFFLLALAMSSSVIPINDVINEYRVYLPSVGFYLVLVVGADALLRAASPGPRLRRAVALGCALVVCLLAGATVARNRVWLDGLTFWQDTGRTSPGKVRVAASLAEAYLSRGMPGAALDTLRTLARLNPRLGKPHFLMGQVLMGMGRVDDAVAEFERARAIRSDVAEVHAGLASAYLAQGRLDLAADALDALERLEPWSPALGALRARLAPGPGGAP